MVWLIVVLAPIVFTAAVYDGPAAAVVWVLKHIASAFIQWDDHR